MISVVSTDPEINPAKCGIFDKYKNNSLLLAVADPDMYNITKTSSSPSIAAVATMGVRVRLAKYNAAALKEPMNKNTTKQAAAIFP